MVQNMPRLSIGLIKERLIKRAQRSRMDPGAVSLAGGAYEGGRESGFRVASELDLLFVVKGNDARLRFLSLVMNYGSGLSDGEIRLTSLPDHQVFVNEKLDEFFCEFLRQALFDLRQWSREALEAGVIDQFDLAVARRAHSLRKRMSQESQALIATIFNSKYQHVQAVKSGKPELRAPADERQGVFFRQQPSAAHL
jgi:hypothetical protein